MVNKEQQQQEEQAPVELENTPPNRVEVQTPEPDHGTTKQASEHQPED